MYLFVYKKKLIFILQDYIHTAASGDDSYPAVVATLSLGSRGVPSKRAATTSSLASVFSTYGLSSQSMGTPSARLYGPIQGLFSRILQVCRILKLACTRHLLFQWQANGKLKRQYYHARCCKNN